MPTISLAVQWSGWVGQQHPLALAIQARSLSWGHAGSQQQILLDKEQHLDKATAQHKEEKRQANEDQANASKASEKDARAKDSRLSRPARLLVLLRSTGSQEVSNDDPVHSLAQAHPGHRSIWTAPGVPSRKKIHGNSPHSLALFL